MIEFLDPDHCERLAKMQAEAGVEYGVSYYRDQHDRIQLAHYAIMGGTVLHRKYRPNNHPAYSIVEAEQVFTLLGYAIAWDSYLSKGKGKRVHLYDAAIANRDVVTDLCDTRIKALCELIDKITEE
jgi:hypothetical protein